MAIKKVFKTVRCQWKVPIELEEHYRLIASVGGVSVDRLVTYVLTEWVKRNRQLLMDESLPSRLASLLKTDSINKP